MNTDAVAAFEKEMNAAMSIGRSCFTAECCTPSPTRCIRAARNTGPNTMPQPTKRWATCSRTRRSHSMERGHRVRCGWHRIVEACSRLATCLVIRACAHGGARSMVCEVNSKAARRSIRESAAIAPGFFVSGLFVRRHHRRLWRIARAVMLQTEKRSSIVKSAR
jgi:hypothetical protein